MLRNALDDQSSKPGVDTQRFPEGASRQRQRLTSVPNVKLDTFNGQRLNNAEGDLNDPYGWLNCIYARAPMNAGSKRSPTG